MYSHGLVLRITSILISECIVLTRNLVIDSATLLGNSRKDDGFPAKCHEQVGENTGYFCYLHVYNSLYMEVHTCKMKLQ